MLRYLSVSSHLMSLEFNISIMMFLVLLTLVTLVASDQRVEPVVLSHRCRRECQELSLILKLQPGIKERSLEKKEEVVIGDEIVCRFYTNFPGSEVASLQMCGEDLSGSMVINGQSHSIERKGEQHKLIPTGPVGSKEPASRDRGYASGSVQEVSYIELVLVDGTHSMEDLKRNRKQVLVDNVFLINHLDAVFSKLNIRIIFSALRIPNPIHYPVNTFVDIGSYKAYIDNVLRRMNKNHSESLRGEPDLVLFLLSSSASGNQFAVQNSVCKRYPIMTLKVSHNSFAAGGEYQRQTVIRAAEIIGQVLGLKGITGDKESGCDCEKKDGYCIMSNKPIKDKSLRWSTCSKEELLKHFTNIKLDCLQEQNTFLETSVFDPIEMNQTFRMIITVFAGAFALLLLIQLIPQNDK